MNRKERRSARSTPLKDRVRFRSVEYPLETACQLALQWQLAGNVEEASDLYRLILVKSPDNARCMNNLGYILTGQGQLDEAISLYRRAIVCEPTYSFAYQNMADALVMKGEIAEAETMFCKTLTLTPNFPKAYFGLANIRKYKTTDNEEAVRLKHLINNITDAQHDQDYLYLALGKIYDDCGLYDEAFACYQKANQICNAQIIYSPEAIERDTRNIITTFTKEFLAQDFPFGSDSKQPLFIVGMPRSGTTLLASILSNHPAIKASGELPTIIENSEALPKMIPDAPDYPMAVKYMTTEVAAKLIRNHEKRLRQGHDPNLPYIIDKHPINFRYLGLITMLFPKAHVIHCTRNPLDSCLSNYFQRFALDYHYSFDLRNIGHYYNEYRRLMAHWNDALPLKMIEVRYEDTVTDTEQSARKMLEFLGLEWDERCLSPHTNPRAIRTASMWQVRQPIYKRSLERWRHYEKHLGPLKEALPETLYARNGSV